MHFGRKLRFVPVALALLIVFLTTARAFGASPGSESNAERAAVAQTAQPEPAGDVDAGLLAGATWILLLPLVLMARLKISESRRAAWFDSLPRLQSHEISDYLEDYRLDPDAQFRR